MRIEAVAQSQSSRIAGSGKGEGFSDRNFQDDSSRTADIAEKSVGGEDPGIESWLADCGIYMFQSVCCS